MQVVVTDLLAGSPSGLTVRLFNPATHKPSTLNPQPSTLNPQPSTLNPQPSTNIPSTLNPQPSTLNPRPSTFHHQLRNPETLKLTTLNPKPETPQRQTPGSLSTRWSHWLGIGAPPAFPLTNLPSGSGGRSRSKCASCKP